MSSSLKWIQLNLAYLNSFCVVDNVSFSIWMQWCFWFKLPQRDCWLRHKKVVLRAVGTFDLSSDFPMLPATTCANNPTTNSVPIKKQDTSSFRDGVFTIQVQASVIKGPALYAVHGLNLPVTVVSYRGQTSVNASRYPLISESQNWQFIWCLEVSWPAFLDVWECVSYVEILIATRLKYHLMNWQ